MYRKEIEQLQVAIQALDVLIEATSNIYASVDSFRLDLEPIKQSIDALLYGKQYLVAQLNILIKAQEELVPTMEQ